MILYRNNDFSDVRSTMFTNRDRKTAPSPNRAAWCDRCDRNLIRPGEKCSVCGFRDSFTKHQKP